MKNILVLNGAARKNGNTAKLLEAFIEGAKSTGHNVEAFYLQSMDIHGCIGCDGCKNSQKGCDNPCVQNDNNCFVEINNRKMADKIYIHFAREKYMGFPK